MKMTVWFIYSRFKTAAGLNYDSRLK